MHSVSECRLHTCLQSMEFAVFMEDTIKVLVLKLASKDVELTNAVACK